MADQRENPEKVEREKEDAEVAGVTAAAGLGCLGFSLLPWAVMILVIIILLLVWVFAYHGAR